jgi:hypothetical protein
LRRGQRKQPEVLAIVPLPSPQERKRREIMLANREPFAQRKNLNFED